MELIVAVDRNWVIGRDGDQLAYLSEDLKRFKALTMGKTVILGRKTLATFPGGKPLKGRDNLILSTDMNYVVEGAAVAHSVAEAVAERGWLGVLTGGLTATSGGIAAAVVFSLLAAVLVRPKEKR